MGIASLHPSYAAGRMTYYIRRATIRVSAGISINSLTAFPSGP